VVRVPASNAAPHRAPDLHAYVRRDTESKPMSMREIQDLTLASATRANQIENRFQMASGRLASAIDRMTKLGRPASGYKIVALPATPLSLPRLYGTSDFVFQKENYLIKVGGTNTNAYSARLGQRRPILRGLEYYLFTDNNDSAFSIYQDGAIEFHSAGSYNETRDLYIGWIIPSLVNVLITAGRLRAEAGSPDLEYSIEIEFSVSPSLENLIFMNWGNSYQRPIGAMSLLPMNCPV
jgi:hypothetical protein